ncbi:MAG: AAA family ATPase [Bacteroidales bacterium]|jgi:AAA15 family ATPase/GTPase|nr:AAA family ATPase [Bacteroidales bacterium]
MIKEISVKNFKCFENEEKFYFSKLNLLTGINGRGKSSVLQSLLLVSQTFLKRKTPQQLVLNGEWIELGTFDDIKNDNSKENTILFQFKTDDNDQNDMRFIYGEAKESERIASIVSLIINGEEKYVEPADATDTKNDNSNIPLQQQPQSRRNLDNFSRSTR